MKLNIIKLLKNNNNNILLKNLLLNNIIINNNINTNINNNNNINNNILKNNKSNNWIINNYNYNNNNTINNIINDIITIRIIKKIINIRINKVLISKPVFNHTIDNLTIKFYYYNIDNNNNNNYYNIIINLLNNINKLSNILSYFYNKKVIIKPIKLSYIYLNNDIFSKYISYLINNSLNLNNKIMNINNKTNVDSIFKEYLNIFNNIIPLNINKNNNTNNNDYNNININNIPINLLIYKYLIGWSIILKGKLNKINTRTNTLLLINGTFKNNNNNKYYKLNYLPNNNYLSSSYNINKDGKYNIKVKLNYN